jgi:hypothetical protein
MNHPHVFVTPTTDPDHFYHIGLPRPALGQGSLPNINISFDGHLSNTQIQRLCHTLNDTDGPLSFYLTITYRISTRHHPRLLSALLKNIPVRVQSYNISYLRPQHNVNVRVYIERLARGEWNMRAKVSIPVDCDFFQLEADLEHAILATVDHVQLQAPLSGDNFRNNEEHVLDNVRVFIVSRLRSLRKVTITVLAPLSVSSILVALGLTVVNLETIRLTPGDGQYPVEDLQSAILHGLSRFNRMPHIVLPGSFFSWDFFLRLGDLPIRDLSFDSIIPPAFLPSTVRTPRARCFELFDGSSSKVINRIRRFKHLRYLSLTASLDLIVDMHGILTPIKSMTGFTLTIPTLDAPTASTQIYRRIATLFPSLATFHLELQRAHDLETPAWLDIPGLLAFEHLDDLSITHPFPLAIDDCAVARLLHAWPLMTRLSLNPCPRVHVWPHTHEDGNGDVASLTWDVLRGVVRRNGVLKALGVYLGAQEYACAPVARELGEVMDSNYVLQQLLVGTDGPMLPDSFTVLAGMFKRGNVENAF